MKARKKPVEIDYMILTENNVKEVYEWIYSEKVVTDTNTSRDKWDGYESGIIEFGLRLKTMESDNETQKADIGDVIIKGVKGEFYPCKPDIFELTYDKVLNEE